MTARTYAAAEALARAAVRAHMEGYGRALPNAGDRAAGARLKARLLWLVEGEDGGFIGLSDAELIERCNSYGLAYSTVSDAMYAPGDWPESEIKTEREAA